MVSRSWLFLHEHKGKWQTESIYVERGGFYGIYF